MLTRQKKSKQDYLIRIIAALQKEKIGNYDYLEEIMLDLEEHIPLSQKKTEHLKMCISELKELKKAKANTNPESDNKNPKIIPHENKTTKKPLFGRVFGKKNKQNVSNPQPAAETQNFDIAKQTDVQKFMPATEKKAKEEPLNQDSQDAQKTKKEGGFFKFFNKKKTTKQNNKPTQFENQANDQKTVQNGNNAKDSASFSKPNRAVNEAIDSIDYELPETTEIEEQTMIEISDINVDLQKENRNIDTPKKSQLGIKHVLDELNKETEILRTDIEEIRQLDDIKQLLEELSKEKEQLKTNVEEIKTHFSVKPLVKKYDEIEQKLQSSADNLYSIQSNIYERIKEIRILRKDLSVIKEDLDSLNY